MTLLNNFFLNSSEKAALESFRVLHSKDKYLIDEKAVDSYTESFKDCENLIVIKNGEGELEESAHLANFSTYGKKNSKTVFDLSIDPIEGTSNAANQSGYSATCLAFCSHDAMKSFPEMYMEKWFAKPKYFENVDFCDNFENILKIIFLNINKTLPSVIILNKKRHEEKIKIFKNFGFEVRLINDGDVLACLDVISEKADLLYGIGGAPEGVLMAALAISTNYQFHYRLENYETIWPSENETEKRKEMEKQYLHKNMISCSQWFNAYDAIKDKSCHFITCALLSTSFLKAIKKENNIYTVNSFYSCLNKSFLIESKYIFNEENVFLLAERNVNVWKKL